MTHSLFDLSGRTALVTGGTHGLGLAMAEAMAEMGANIILNGHTPGKLEKAVEFLKEKGIKAEGFLCDITEEPKVKEHIARFNESTGIDILVNNAATTKRIELLDVSLEDFERIVKVDLTGALIMSRQVVPGMMKRGYGKIINICSMMSELSRETTGPYAAAKGGLAMLTKSMAAEWAACNIQVNGIGPGYFETDQTSDLFIPGNRMYEFIRSRTPAARWGKPEDIKGAVIFLASKASDFVNGHILYVDGGFLHYKGHPPE